MRCNACDTPMDPEHACPMCGARPKIYPYSVPELPKVQKQAKKQPEELVK